MNVLYFDLFNENLEDLLARRTDSKISFLLFYTAVHWLCRESLWNPGQLLEFKKYSLRVASHAPQISDTITWISHDAVA